MGCEFESETYCELIMFARDHPIVLGLFIGFLGICFLSAMCGYVED